MGEWTGVARQEARPDVVTYSGKVLAVQTEPCENTTGGAYLGTHFLLKTSAGEKLNIHLGPAISVDFVTDELPIGGKVEVDVFRTAKMPENHYVAQVLTFDETTIRLRDENLRPVWAGGSAAAATRRGDFQQSPGRGPNRRWGRGPGYGRGWARRSGWGRGWRGG
jgi:hypothetical protein